MVHSNPKCMLLTHILCCIILYLFIFVGHLDVMKLLVEKFGAEIAEKQDNQLTKPMYFAAQEGVFVRRYFFVSILSIGTKEHVGQGSQFRRVVYTHF